MLPLVQVKVILMATTLEFVTPKRCCGFSGYRCNVIYGTPTMYIDMINHRDFDKYDLSSVRKGEVRLFFIFTFPHLHR